MLPSFGQNEHATVALEPNAQRPGPWRITFDTNPDDCNLHCIMCEGFSPYSTVQAERRRSGKPKRRMSIDLIRKILDDALGTPLREIIPSTMGEPLLYHHMEDIIALCHEHSIKLNLTTNGTFPGKGAIGWAEQIVPVASDVKISWNGGMAATHESIMLGVRWRQVVQNVRDFISVRDNHAKEGRNRCRVTFQMTFLETNVGELADIVKLAAELGVERVKGHHLWVHFRETEGLSMRRSPEAISRWNYSVADAVRAADTYRLPDGEKVLLDNIYPLDSSAVVNLAPNAPCPFLRNEAWVSAEGRFDPCCAPDSLRRTLGYFGNLHEQTLREIWQGESYRHLRETYHNYPLCRSCNMRRPLTT